MVQFAVEIISKLLCISLLMFQGLTLDAYLSKLHNNYWWSWVVADAVAIVVWICCLLAVRKSFEKIKQMMERGDYVDGRDPEQSPDEIKYAYVAWLSYVILLSPRIVLIFLNLDERINNKALLGPNLLKVSVSCTPLIYLALVYGFHNATPQSARKLYIQSIAASGALDLFDSTDLLDLLFMPKEEVLIPKGYARAIVVFSLINLFLPSLALYGIRIQTRTGRVSSFHFKLLNVISVMGFVNIPNLVIRSLLWHNHEADVSVLLMKNVMCFFLGVYEILEYFGENRPQQCKNCKDWYEKSTFSKHGEICKNMVHSMIRR